MARVSIFVRGYATVDVPDELTHEEAKQYAESRFRTDRLKPIDGAMDHVEFYAYDYQTDNDEETYYYG